MHLLLPCMQRESNALYEQTTVQRVKLLTAEVLRRKRHMNDLRLAEVEEQLAKQRTSQAIECAICLAEADTPLVGICGHIFCRDCVLKTAQASLNKIAERRHTYGPVSSDCLASHHIALQTHSHSQDDSFLKIEVKKAKKAEKLLKDLTGAAIAVPECPTCKRPGAFHTLYYNK